MAFWMTTHWPRRVGDDPIRSPGVWVTDAKRDVITPIKRGDRVWLYESATGRTVRQTNADGSVRDIPCLAGKKGIIALLEVTKAAYAPSDTAPETYIDGGSLWWRWHAPTVTLNSSGFVPRETVAKILGYNPSYVFRGFGDSKSGLKRLDASVFYALQREYDRSCYENDRRKLEEISALPRRMGSGGEGPIHKAIKSALAKDPAGFLRQPGLSLVKTEHEFPTGDRIDVLLRDQDGRYLAVEIEPDCSELEICGPLQCMKYRALVAYMYDRPYQEVRTMLVSRTIHETVSRKCSNFDIEVYACGDSYQLEERAG